MREINMAQAEGPRKKGETDSDDSWLFVAVKVQEGKVTTETYDIFS